jgi:hypothetical protein
MDRRIDSHETSHGNNGNAMITWYTIRAIILAPLLCAACSDTINGQDAMVSKDISALSQLMNLSSVEVQTVKWEKSSPAERGSELVPGPSDGRLFALLQISPSSWQSLKQRSEVDADVSGNLYLEGTIIRPWLPEDVVKSFGDAQGYVRPVGPAYAPTEFLKSPYVSGFYVLCEQSQVFVYMFSM